MTRVGDEMTAQHTFGSRGSADIVPLGWGIYEQPPLIDDVTTKVWWCVSCPATGSAPTFDRANQDAATHRRAAHTLKEPR